MSNYPGCGIFYMLDLDKKVGNKVCANMRGVVIWRGRLFISYMTHMRRVRKRMFAVANCQNSKLWVDCIGLSGFAAL